MFLRKLLLGLLMVVTIQSCNSDDDNKKNDEENNASSFTKISELINFNNVKTDTLSFNPNVYSIVEGSKGTKIMINQNSIKPKTTGGAIPDELFVVLREYLTVNDMVKSGIKTMSGDNVLVTGGNFWWDIIDAEGNQWELINNFQVNAQQPILTDMGGYLYNSRYFVGTVKEEQGNEVVDWDIEAGAESSVGYEEGEQEDGVSVNFYIYGLKLGWANCDIYYDFDGDKTQLKAKLITNVNLKPLNVSLIFIPKEFPSIISSYRMENNHFTINGIPVGIEGILIGVGLSEDDKLLFGSKVITVKEDVMNEIELNYGTQEEFTALVDNYTK